MKPKPRTKNKNEKFIRTVADRINDLYYNRRVDATLYPDMVREWLERDCIIPKRTSKALVAAYGAALRRAGFRPTTQKVRSLHPKARGRHIRVWVRAASVS